MFGAIRPFSFLIFLLVDIVPSLTILKSLAIDRQISFYYSILIALFGIIISELAIKRPYQVELLFFKLRFAKLLRHFSPFLVLKCYKKLILYYIIFIFSCQDITLPDLVNLFLIFRLYTDPKSFDLRKSMRKKVIKVALLVSGLMAYLFSARAVLADPFTDLLLWGGRQTEVQALTGLSGKDPILIVANLIRVLLGFIGLIALVIIILGGLRWMTAGGDEDKVTAAKKMIGRAIVGIIIILASLAIAQYVLNTLVTITY